MAAKVLFAALVLAFGIAVTTYAIARYVAPAWARIKEKQIETDARLTERQYERDERLVSEAEREATERREDDPDGHRYN